MEILTLENCVTALFSSDTLCLCLHFVELAFDFAQSALQWVVRISVVFMSLAGHFLLVNVRDCRFCRGFGCNKRDKSSLTPTPSRCSARAVNNSSTCQAPSFRNEPALHFTKLTGLRRRRVCVSFSLPLRRRRRRPTRDIWQRVILWLIYIPPRQQLVVEWHPQQQQPARMDI